MMTKPYKLPPGDDTSRILRVDGATIPNDPENADWAAYQAWLSDGNAPDPADPEPVVYAPLTRQAFFRTLFTELGMTRATLETAAGSIPDATARELALIDIAEAPLFRRDNPLVGQLAQAIGVSDAQINAAWLKGMAAA